MFYFALWIGGYSYLIFFLGILGWLYKPLIIAFTIVFLLLNYKSIKKLLLAAYELTRKTLNKKKMMLILSRNKLMVFFGVLLALQAFINLIGVLGPERGFDALWYHLTLPKLYLTYHAISFIPGGLLYYSTMPKLAEMLYTAGLAFGDETIPKFIHFAFGLLTCLALYKLSRKFFNALISLIAVVIFYSNLVLGWESIAAYIDLVRAFFEVMALWAFVEWFENGKKKMFILSAVMVGLAITTKILAIGSLAIFVTLIILKGGRKVRIVRDVGVYIFLSLLIPLPWFIFSYLHTGNPVYPFFSELYKVVPEPFSFIGFFKEGWMLFTHASDPLSLVYILFLPLVVWLVLRKEKGKSMSVLKIIGLYCLLAVVVWYFTPRTGGGRFILAYLPAFSLLCVAVVHEFWNKRIFSNLLVGIIILASLFSISYRFVANTKYLPVILGQQTKQAFLTKYLNFSYGDFYDTDSYFQKHIKQSDTVLLYGFHNLYYVDFPFIDASWLHKGDIFTYIATQNTALPQQFNNWKLVYTNQRTMVKLYKAPR